LGNFWRKLFIPEVASSESMATTTVAVKAVEVFMVSVEGRRWS
jgi:hypothetical protein